MLAEVHLATSRGCFKRVQQLEDYAYQHTTQLCRLMVVWVDCRCFLSFVFLGGESVWSFLRVTHKSGQGIQDCSLGQPKIERLAEVCLMEFASRSRLVGEEAPLAYGFLGSVNKYRQGRAGTIESRPSCTIQHHRPALCWQSASDTLTGTPCYFTSSCPNACLHVPAWNMNLC